MTDYDRAFGFWRLLAELNVSLGSSKALVNTSAPFILSNALWYPGPESILELSEFYDEQHISASCFLSVALDENLFQALALSNAGLARTAQYGFTPVMPTPGPELIVEQVSWAQTRLLGEVIAAAYDLDSYAVAVGQALALAMQLEPDLSAFVVYDGRPTGALVTLAAPEILTAFVLEALTPEADAALRARLVFEAETQGKRAQVFECVEVGELELWR